MVLSILRHLQRLLPRKYNARIYRFGGFYFIIFVSMEAHAFLRLVVESLVENTSAIEITEIHDEL